MKKPLIGVVPLVDVQRDSYWMLPGYMEGIIQAGGIPIMFPLTSNQEMIKELTEKCDGFLFTGGHDVTPNYYGHERISECGECCKERDTMEDILFHLIYKQDKPILGICRGIQFINAALGGTLYQDLPTECPSSIEHHQKPPYNIPIHSVKLLSDSPLYGLLETETLWVNSYHHQAVRNLAPELKAMAFSEDGLIEAVYAPTKKFIWAVQWHPEFLFKNDIHCRKIFKAFVDVAL